jgi:dTDP-4-dehydrorhamnose 3,5-epimerase
MSSAGAPDRPIVLPTGSQLRRLTMHGDERGVLTEMFRETWDVGISPKQWNMVRTAAGVLRGVHVHPRHVDYLLVLDGRATIGLRDLREGSPTAGLATTVEMRGDELSALTIPTGVAHGFYFHEPSIFVYAVSEYWDPADELGCHWADPALEISWPVKTALVSERDEAAPPLSEIVGLIPPFGHTSA